MELLKFIDELPRWFRKVILSITDIMVIVVAYMLTNIFKETKVEFFSEVFIESVVTAVVVYMVVFNLMHIYRSIVRYSSVKEYMKIGLAGILSIILASCVKEIVNYQTMSVVTNTLAGFFVIVMAVSYRVFFRLTITYIANRSNKKKQRVLIIGAGEATSQIINSIKNHMGNEYVIVGIVDDNPKKQRSSMYGVSVIGKREDIKKIVDKENIDIILFSIHNIKAGEKNAILKICNETKANTKVMLPVEDLIHGKALSDSFRDIQVEDLLGRDPIKLDNDEISKYLNEKVVLVTGAGGSIGSELCRQIVEFKPKLLIMLDIYENTLYEVERELEQKNPNAPIVTLIASVRDKKRIDRIFSKYKPQVVFHAAAHKHVPLMETSPAEAIKNNVFGTYNVVNSADKFKAERFILISTDKAVNPTSIMGATKRICEMIIQAKNQNSKTNFVAVRFGNVLGSHGSVIPLFKSQLEAGGPLTVTHKDITRYFMLIPEAVGLILQAITFAKGGEIFVLDMGEPVRIYDLAKAIIKLSGRPIQIKITGLRPGEKLYEELLINGEGLTKTLHEKIMVSKIQSVNLDSLKYYLALLREMINKDNCSRDEVKSLIKEIVPTFIDEEQNKVVSIDKAKLVKRG